MRSFHLTCMPGVLPGGTEWLHSTMRQSAESLVKGHESHISLQEAVPGFSDHFQHVLHLAFMTSQKHQQNSDDAFKSPSPKNSPLHCSLQKPQGRTVISQGKPCLSCTVPIFCVLSHLWTNFCHLSQCNEHLGDSTMLLFCVCTASCTDAPGSLLMKIIANKRLKPWMKHSFWRDSRGKAVRGKLSGHSQQLVYRVTITLPNTPCVTASHLCCQHLLQGNRDHVTRLILDCHSK